MKFRITSLAGLVVLFTPLLANVVAAQVQVIEAGAPVPAQRVVLDQKIVPAQKQVSDSSSLQGISNASAGSVSAGSAQGELFYQLQLLQDEVMQLRGTVEEQQHLIRQLQQQRLDDYLNLDKRISEFSTRGQTGVERNAPSTAADATNLTTKTPGLVNSIASADEAAAYKSAYNLVKAQKFPEAKSAFETFTQRFPDGSYRPNALYWLGELYLLESDQESARQAFTQLIDQYADHRKKPDAMFKLAKVYHLQGNRDKSKVLLNKVIEQYGREGHSAARLAKDYLEKNFNR